jgi:L-ascorbate metabolism protein UlaG (beta-lactamase superfamily)
MSRIGGVARVASVAALSAAAAGVAVLARSTDWFASLGAGATGARLDRMRRSPQWSAASQRFVNTNVTHTMLPGAAVRTLRLQVAGTEARYPSRPIPVEARRRADVETPPASGLRATWLGHATALVEIDGARILTDPVWSERVSPSSLVGPRRFFEPPIALDDLPRIDAVVISHDHYDHLDMETVKTLAGTGARFCLPLGVGAHLEKWGIPADRIDEREWGEGGEIAGVTITAAPARHFSGRRLSDRDATLWCSWVIAGPRHRVYYSGDSGYFEGYREIGRASGPFDLTLMSLGAYGPTWPLIHMTPEELVQAQQDLRGELLLPVHWATFNLAFHAWNDPAIRMAADARAHGVRFTIPRPGEMVEPAKLPEPASEPAPEPAEWWRE